MLSRKYLIEIIHYSKCSQLAFGIANVNAHIQNQRTIKRDEEQNE